MRPWTPRASLSPRDYQTDYSRPEGRGFQPSQAGVPVSQLTAAGRTPECLTSAPQAETARPAATMFFAALTSVDHDQVPSGAPALVLKLAAEIAPPAVGDGLGQPPVADQVLNGKVLNDDHVVVADHRAEAWCRKSAREAGTFRWPRATFAQPSDIHAGMVAYRSTPTGHMIRLACPAPGWTAAWLSPAASASLHQPGTGRARPRSNGPDQV